MILTFHKKGGPFSKLDSVTVIRKKVRKDVKKEIQLKVLLQQLLSLCLNTHCIVLCAQLHPYARWVV